MSEVLTGRGAIVKIGDGNDPQGYVDVSNVVTIRSLGGKRPQFEDATLLNTPAGERVLKKIDDTLDPLIFEYFHVPDDGTHDDENGLLRDEREGWIRDFRVKVPGSSNKWVECSGRVSVELGELVRNTFWRATATVELESHEWITNPSWAAP